MSTAVSTNSDLLTRAEAAAFLRIRPQTLAVWATSKRYNLRLVKVGSRVFYRRADLLRFLDSRTVGGSESSD
jgi:hypothetical protein